MTAKTLAAWALEEALTQALIGEEIRSTSISAAALATIARFGNQIDDRIARQALTGDIRFPPEAKG